MTDIDDEGMARLIRLMNPPEEVDEEEAKHVIEEMSVEDIQALEIYGQPRGEPEILPPIVVPIGLKENESDFDLMKGILERFHDASDDVISSSSMSRELRESLVTEATPNGSRIGKWEIRVNQVSGRKFYDIAAVGFSDLVIGNLTLYEAAVGIVRALNEGHGINSRQALALITEENKYSTALEEAILYKQKMATRPNDTRMAVFEARYSEAKGRALSAKDNVKKLVE